MAIAEFLRSAPGNAEAGEKMEGLMMKNRMCNGKLSERVIIKNKDDRFYPLVNIQKNMKNQSFLMGKPTISMAIFNSYVKLPDSTVS